MRRYRSALVCAVVSACVLAEGAVAADFKVVANPSVPVTSLTRATLSSAFLKKTDKWPDGTPVVPVDQSHDSTVRQSFCREVHDKSLAMVDAFWQKQVFSGRATPPLAKANDTDVIAYVRSVPGAIGYVSTSAEAAGLKQIRVE